MNLFIVNPGSGSGTAKEFSYAIKEVCEKEKIPFKIFYSKDANDLIDLATYCANIPGDNTIYSVGGDGTLNKIVNGLLPNSKLCVIPAGSGNDFYRVSKEIDGNKKINLGMVNEYKFINIASLGVDAAIADKANRLKEKYAKYAYQISIATTLFSYKPINIEINDNKTSATLFTVCNGKYYGNGVPIAPNYDLSDDRLNIIKADALSKPKIVKLLLGLQKGNHLKSEKVYNWRTEEVSVKSSDELICNVDGEIIRDTSFNFKIVKDGIILTNNIHPKIKQLIKNA